MFIPLLLFFCGNVQTPPVAEKPPAVIVKLGTPYIEERRTQTSKTKVFPNLQIQNTTKPLK
jgi:hypothetical protein